MADRLSGGKTPVITSRHPAHVDDAGFGRTIRALRLRRGWRRRDLAAACEVSQQLISSLERGHAASFSLATLRRVASAAEMRLALRAEWRGGELDRLLDADHAALQAAARRWSEGLGWQVGVEVTFSRYGERGSVDLLAFHAPSRALLVVEVKTVVADLQSLLRGIDTKARLAAGIARERGWHAAQVVACLLLADGATNRRRVVAAAPLLARFSLRARPARAWLRHPGPAEGLLLFLSPPPTNRGGGRRAGRQRMRLRKTSPSVGGGREGSSQPPDAA